jgi:predicted Rossmann fold nucleotide-binding protein DprA/Smf involved in DNA uptake
LSARKRTTKKKGDNGGSELPLPKPITELTGGFPPVTESEAERDAFALLMLFYFRRTLDYAALSHCVRWFHPLASFFDQTESQLKNFFARIRHLRGYVDAAQLASPMEQDAATRYAERQMATMAGAVRGRLVLEHHPAFPRRLAPTALPIDWLFCHPSTSISLPRPVVAIVGSRQSSRPQLAVAAAAAEAVGALAGTVITGLATGADIAAHHAARDTEASLIGVLGSGAGKPYPAEAAGYVKELLTGRGTVLSEVPPDYTPDKDAFVLRNRIVAALADVVVAVSGKYASGTSHTLRFAADARVPVISLDPAPASGITKLAIELGGHAMNVAEFGRQLRREDD